MSIDGIGRPPVPPGGGGSVQGPSATGGAKEAFQVERRADAGVAGVTPESSGLLERLERGELSVEQYLDERVAEAVAPLESRLSPEQLEFVRSSLRAELESDPVLIEMVQRATRGAGSAESNG